MCYDLEQRVFNIPVSTNKALILFYITMEKS